MLFSLFLVSCEKDEITTALAPEVKIGSVTNIYRTGASLSADISRSEGRSIVESGFILSTNKDFEGMTLDKIKASSACTIVTTGTPVTAGTMTIGVTGLQANTHYYCCAFVSSGYSVARSEVSEFTTAEATEPLFTDIVFSDLSVTSCTASFQLIDIGGEDKAQTLELWYKPVGTNQTPETLDKNDCSIIDASGYSATLRDLNQNTRYAVCVHIVTNTGREAKGKVAFFTTSNINVSFGTPVINTAQDHVTVTQSVTTTEEVIKEGVFYSSEVKTPTEYNLAVLDQTVDKNVNIELTGLEKGTYYIRPFVQVLKDGSAFYIYNDVIEVNVEGFMQPLPQLSGCSVDAVTSSSITVSAAVTNATAYIERGFCYVYGTDTPTINDNSVTISANKEFRATLQPLPSDTDVTICAYAISETGVGYGAPVTVHTSKKTPSMDDNEFPEISN